LLLPYTSRWPLLHAIMTEKDSRRILYFMSYVWFLGR
jgi:zinc transporter 5/7